MSVLRDGDSEGHKSVSNVSSRQNALISKSAYRNKISLLRNRARKSLVKYKKSVCNIKRLAARKIILTALMCKGFVVHLTSYLIENEHHS